MLQDDFVIEARELDERAAAEPRQPVGRLIIAAAGEREMTATATARARQSRLIGAAGDTERFYQPAAAAGQSATARGWASK